MYCHFYHCNKQHSIPLILLMMCPPWTCILNGRQCVLHIIMFAETSKPNAPEFFSRPLVTDKFKLLAYEQLPRSGPRWLPVRLQPWAVWVFDIEYSDSGSQAPTSDKISCSAMTQISSSRWKNVAYMIVSWKTSFELFILKPLTKMWQLKNQYWRIKWINLPAGTLTETENTVTFQTLGKKKKSRHTCVFS